MTSRLFPLAMLAGVLLIRSHARAQQAPIPLSLPDNFAAGKSQSVSVKGAGATASLTLSPLSSPSDWIPSNAPLPGGMFAHALVSSGNKTFNVGGQPVRMLYTIGGQNGNTFLKAVLTATVDANGVVSPFTPSANPLPISRAYHTATLYNNVIYVVGGDTSATSSANDLEVSKTVLMSVLDANGQPGPWVETTALPEERDTVAVTAAKGTLYAVGGAPVGEFLVGTTNTWAAPIHADGSLGAWNSVTVDPATFPKRFGAGAFTLADDLWVAGGVDLNDAEARFFSLADVRRAPLGPDGAPEPWVSQENLPIDLGYINNSTVVAQGRVFLVGGQQNGSPTSAVIVGTPNNFGRIAGTDWAASVKSLPTALNLTATALTGGDTLVTAGGQDVAGVEQSGVYTNKLAPVDPAKFASFGSFESGVIDLGSVRNLVSFNFTVTPTIPAGAGTAQVEVRVAGTDGVFGNWTAPTGTSPLAVNQNGRYVQYRILLGVDQTVAGTGAPEVSGLSLTPGSFVYGDANLDGSVDVLDAIKILRVVVGIDTATPDEVKAADVAPKPGLNGQPVGDGNLDVSDAVRILRAIVGLETLP